MSSIDKTRELILNSALELFIEKGYHETSTNDIRIRANNLSRGGLYHYFPRKEDILNALPEYLLPYKASLDNLMENTDLTAMEKIRLLLKENYKGVMSTSKGVMFLKLLSGSESLNFLFDNLKSSIVPLYEQLIRMGNEDGSMNITEPEYTAEFLAILLNIWFNPLFLKTVGTEEEIDGRINFLENTTNFLGLSLFDEEIRELCKSLWLTLSEIEN
ncbi:TetR/AcrR family transcriptional regulator [Enterococcus sp. S23]|nr:TetR/AcrR family transcriptional regulator [Enterococcus sp. S23]MCA5015673.1 TetR/AcrR family transcriptional regulator [Enterococcus sp. S22(2020)]